MAKLVGPTGHINALDSAPENIETLNERLAESDFSGIVETEVGNVTSLGYQDDTFDAVWCANVSQYLNGEELTTLLAEFRRVTRPGGLVAIKEFDASLTRFFPSDPTLLWRVIEANQFNKSPIHYTLRTVGLSSWFEQAGLIEVRQKTTLTERRPPLQPVSRQQIGMFFTYMATIADQSGLSQTDMTAWRGLQDISDPNHIMNQRDFYFREGHMLVVGRVPEASV